MLMKYKDFKQMTNEDMKQIQGGVKSSMVCACNTPSMYTNVCYPSSFSSGLACAADTQAHCPSATVSCSGSIR